MIAFIIILMGTVFIGPSHSQWMPHNFTRVNIDEISLLFPRIIHKQKEANDGKVF